MHDGVTNRTRRNSPELRERGEPVVGARVIAYDLKLLWAVLELAGEAGWRFELALVLAHETGHRVGSIRQLRRADVDLEAGWVTWPAETDKTRRRHRTPLTGEAAAALRQARGRSRAEGSGSWIFPSPERAGRPCTRHRVRNRWDDAQAVLEEQGVFEPGVEQMGWHALRRKFASDLRDLPLEDLADLGGWRQTRTITECYLARDEERMVAALERRGGSGD